MKISYENLILKREAMHMFQVALKIYTSIQEIQK